MEYLNTISYQPHVGRFRDEQLRRRDEWNGVPDDEQVFASMHTVTVVPTNQGTTTYVNPLDPGDGTWIENPDCGWGRVLPAGRY